MGLSYTTMDAILKDWWENTNPKEIHDITFLNISDNPNSSGRSIQYTVRWWKKDAQTATDYESERQSVSIDTIKEFISDNI